jgi:hypothetical protein
VDTGPIAEVDCCPEGDRWTLIFVRTFRHSPERVWAALTDPDQLRKWAPFDADRDLGRVGDATLTMVDRDIRQDLPAEPSCAPSGRPCWSTRGATIACAGT